MSFFKNSCTFILSAFIILFGISQAFAKGKGKNDCGHVFNETKSGITNNNLQPDTRCSYYISPVPPTNTTIIKPTRLFIKKLILDDKDNITITAVNQTVLLFPMLHGQKAAVILITENVENLTITLSMSSVKNLTRHFELVYDSVADECTFDIDTDIPDIQEPIVELHSNKTAECKISYINDHRHFKHAFTFLALNLTNASSITVSNIEEASPVITGTNRPCDLFSSGKATFDIKVKEGDRFILHQDHVNSDCSGYLDGSGTKTLSTPNWPKLDNGSLITECRWLLENADGKTVSLSVDDIQLNDPSDVVVISDGSNFDSPPLYQITSSVISEAKDRVIVTSGKGMMVSFNPNSFGSHFKLTAVGQDNGKYLRDSGKVNTVPSNSNPGKWLLQVKENSTVALNITMASFKPPAVLDIYDDFSLKSRQIASLKSDSIWYPILSRTSRMMIISRNFDKGSFSGEFSGQVSGCMHMSQGSSESYTLSKNCNSTCAWIIPPISSNTTDLLLDLQYISLDEHDKITVTKLDKAKTIITTVTPDVTHVPQMTLNADDGAYVEIIRGDCLKKPTDIILVAQANYMPKCSGSKTLKASETELLTSPNFPNTYPLFSNCQMTLTTSPSKQLIHLAFTKFQLAPTHCLTVVESPTSKLNFSGNAVPEDMFFKNDVTLKFSSNDCASSVKNISLTSDLGYNLNATSADCGDIISGKEKGTVVSVANKTLCIWKISVPKGDKDIVNSILYTVTEKDKMQNYELTIIDGNTTTNSQKINNFTGELWSRTDTIIVMYRPLNITKPAGQIEINYKTKSCDKTMQCGNGICMHDDWRCNKINDCGDDTDERQCAPAPIKPVESHGISSVTFGIVCVLMFVLGFGSVFLLRCGAERYRNSRYSRFGEVPVIE